MNIYAIYDEKAQAYNNPFVMNHDGQAARAFEDEAAQPDSMINKHPEDYRLYRIGEYHQETGKIIPEDVPKFVCDGKQVKGEN